MVEQVKIWIFLMLALLVEYIFLTTFYGLYIDYQIWIIQLLVFIEKFSPFAGIWTQDLPGTKPIYYQLSYPGLDI